MEVRDNVAGHEDAIVALFTATFTASEGPEEGTAIGALARALIETTPQGEIRVFTAWEGDGPIGAVIFTRLACAGEARRVMLLSPMAVAPDRQGEGIGQRLIARALDRLRGEGVEVAVTYGDPAFYGKTGFRPVTTDTVPPPHALSQPEGWIAQSLGDAPLTPLAGPCRCAPALDDPAFW